MAQAVGVFIPIVFFLVVGLILVTAFYFRSRERQMLIDKGLDTQSIKEFFERKRGSGHPYLLMQLGIIILAFGIGLGFGMMLQDYTYEDYWIVLFMFSFTGIGFIVANVVTQKLQNKNLRQE
jgi:putative Mn2+ efflux pump MntP